jgi:hypothetical protein
MLTTVVFVEDDVFCVKLVYWGAFVVLIIGAGAGVVWFEFDT